MYSPKLHSGHSTHLTPENYQKLYTESIKSPETFFGRVIISLTKMATELLEWDQPFTCVTSGGFEHGDVAWFSGGKLNVSYNCVDRHAQKTPNKTAIIYEQDEPGKAKYISYLELQQQVCRFANVLKSMASKRVIASQSICQMYLKQLLQC